VKSKVTAFIASAVAFIVALVAVALTLSYRSQDQQITRQLQQVETAQQAASKTAQQASTARLGVCWSSTTDSTTFDVQSVQFQAPVLAGGVYSCPSGMTFVSVVPVSGGC
jgi:Flp pilus assembly protein TadB